MKVSCLCCSRASLVDRFLLDSYEEPKEVDKVSNTFIRRIRNMRSFPLFRPVCIFFHDRLLRACRATKVNTHRLLAFDSPNQDPLATIGITIDENEHLVLPPPRGSLRLHAKMDTRLLTLRLIPGFDDAVIADMIERAEQSKQLRAIVLQLYGTGNLPSVKQSFIQLLGEASEKGILVVASTQCHTGSVRMGAYAVGKALESAGVVSACK